MYIPDVILSEQRFRGKMLGLRVDTLALPDGSSYTREIVEYGVAVVLVPVDEAGCILMVRQYRHAVKEWLLELPAGGVDERDASPEAAAVRELREETGHNGTLTRIGGMFLAPGYSEEYQHVYAAHDLVEDALEADEDEESRAGARHAGGRAPPGRRGPDPRRQEHRRAAHVPAAPREGVARTHNEEGPGHSS